MLAQTKLTPTALARLAGLNSSTLTRFVHYPDGEMHLTFRTLKKISEATGVALPTNLIGKIPTPPRDALWATNEIVVAIGDRMRATEKHELVQKMLEIIQQVKNPR